MKPSSSPGLEGLPQKVPNLSWPLRKPVTVAFFQPLPPWCFLSGSDHTRGQRVCGAPNTERGEVVWPWVIGKLEQLTKLESGGFVT